MSALSKRIVKARIKANLTQDALANRLSITRAACSHWEQGISSPKSKHLVNLCQILEVNHEWLTLGRGEMYTNAIKTTEVFRAKAGGLKASEIRAEYKSSKPNIDNQTEKFARMFFTLAKPERKVVIDMLKVLSAKKPS